MKRFPLLGSLCLLILLSLPVRVSAQVSGSEKKPPEQTSAPQAETRTEPPYSGMYSFLKDGEFVQVTVEDEGRVTGFISRFGDGESDKGAFLDQFFKTAKLDGNKLTFTTEIVHGISFDFRGTVERGDGQKAGDDSYCVIKGTLTENVTDVNKKVTSHSRDVVFKMFPQEASPAPAARN